MTFLRNLSWEFFLFTSGRWEGRGSVMFKEGLRKSVCPLLAIKKDVNCSSCLLNVIHLLLKRKEEKKIPVSKLERDFDSLFPFRS